MEKKVKCTPGWKALSYGKWRQEILRLNVQEWFDKIFVKKGDFKKPNTVIDSKCPPQKKRSRKVFSQKKVGWAYITMNGAPLKKSNLAVANAPNGQFYLKNSVESSLFTIQYNKY